MRAHKVAAYPPVDAGAANLRGEAPSNRLRHAARPPDWSKWLSDGCRHSDIGALHVEASKAAALCRAALRAEGKGAEHPVGAEVDGG
jgi:hypothetical protein